jgi:hypothetical protein
MNLPKAKKKNHSKNSDFIKDLDLKGKKKRRDLHKSNLNQKKIKNKNKMSNKKIKRRNKMMVGTK